MIDLEDLCPANTPQLARIAQVALDSGRETKYIPATYAQHYAPPTRHLRVRVEPEVRNFRNVPDTLHVRRIAPRPEDARDPRLGVNVV